MNSTQPKYLFVYGTLRRSHAPPEISGLMRNLKLVGGGSVSGRLFDLGSYPGAIFDKASGTQINGEVYRLPESPEVLRKLDAYEEFDPKRPRQSLFVRQTIRVRVDGKNLNCWAYRFNSERLKKPAARKSAIKTLRRVPSRASR